MGAADGSVYTRNRANAGEWQIPYLRGGRGEPLLYLHGMGGGGRWESFHIAFANNTLTFAPQLPGFQEYELPAGLASTEDYEAVVTAFLDAVGVERAIVAGHSIGGWLALRLAADRPERVERLIVADALGLQTPAAPAVDLGALDEEEFGKRLLARLGTIATAQPYGFGAEFTNVRTSPEFERQWKGRGLVAALTRGPCADPQLMARLSHIDVPVLIAWGRQDGIAPAEHALLLRDALPNARLALIDGAGHLPMVERRETFHRVCHDFIIGIDEQVPWAVRG
jgi:pimeloyl-ACP methyl ester carboxylesterase